jgi:molybdopterin molybdotransferase
MITIAQAQQTILDAVTTLPHETVPLLQALGRIMAEELHAPWDIPRADYSAMDGYAFGATGEARFNIDGFLPAGETRTLPVPRGEAVKIMTGAVIPPGCDSVVPIEDVEIHDGMLFIRGEIRAGMNVRLRGEELVAGDLVISSGTLLRSAEIGMIATLGRTVVTVIRKPRAAVLSTGDELVEAGTIPEPGQVINSNSYSIAAQLLESGAEPLMLGIARDEREFTLKKLEEGLAADLLITTGGVSVGDRDLVKELLVELGGEIRFWKVSMKPGKPVAFAMVRGKPVFALPGNPVAAMVSFEQFVRPALLKMAGQSRIFRPVVKAVLRETVKNPGKRPHLVRGTVELTGGRYRVVSTGNQSSGRISSLTRSNGLMLIPPDAFLAAGDDVDVQLLDRSFEMGSEIP